MEELCQFLEGHLCKVSHYLAFLVDRYEELMKTDASKSQEYLPKADQVNIMILQITIDLLLIGPTFFKLQLLESLATEIDPMRREYWLFLSRYLNSEFAS